MKRIILMIFAPIFLFLITYQPKIFFGTEDSALAIINAQENLPLTVNFIHSVQKTPVIEELQFKNGEFVLIRTKYKSQGVGLPFDENDGEFYRDGEWFIFDNMNRRFKSLEFRVGKGTQLQITLNGKTYELYKNFPLGTKFTVKSF